MSQRCPRCRIFNTEHAVRCDCGYDFTTKRVEPGTRDAKILLDSARADIQSGLALLALAGTFIVLSLLVERKTPALPVGLTLWGVVRLVRGLRVRRETVPPAAVDRP